MGQDLAVYARRVHRRSSSLVALAASLVLGACAPPRPSQPSPPPRPPVDAALAMTKPAVEALLASEVARTKLPSLAFGLVSKGGLIYFIGLGERDGPGTAVTPDTVYRIGSITKTITGMALLQLRDAGKLSFEDPVARYLPEIGSARYPTADSGLIRIRHLVTHTSGLPRMGKLDYGAWCDVTEWELLRAASGAVLEFAPGSRAVYSNLAMALAGVIVERVSGESYRMYVDGHILGPLGMNHTVWDPESVPPGDLAKAWTQRDGAWVSAGVHWRIGAAEAMGGLYSTVADMSRYVAFQLSAWPPRDAPDDGPLRRSSVRESQLIAGYGRPGNEGFGVNWIVRADPRLGHVVFHNGATEGYHASVFMLPERGVGVVALAPRLDMLDAIAYRALERALSAGAPLRLGDAARIAVARVRALLRAADRTAVERAFSGDFLRAKPADTLVRFFAEVRDAAGACPTTVHVLRADSPTSAELELRCDLHTLRVVLEAQAEPPHLLRGLFITLQ
jgi:CubicO group peptidase (beta-lactamase class C family)